MSRKKKRIGVIGAGAIAQGCHIPGYAAASHCELVAIADPKRSCLKEVEAKGYAFARQYRDYRKMLAAEELDAISICTPNALHKEMALAALKHGADVLLEKPMTLTLAEAQAVARAAKKSRGRVMVGFTHRFNEHCEKAKAALERGTIGKPYMVRIRFAHTGPWPGWARSKWFYNPELAGGGALLDMGIHAFDLAAWFAGPVTRVQAAVGTLRKRIAVDDNAVVALEFDSSCLGYVEVGWTSPAGFCGVELMGDDGTIIIDYGQDRSTVTSGAVRPDGSHTLKTRTLHNRTRQGPWAREMACFTKGLKNSAAFPVGIEAGTASLAVALAAYRSAATGKRVSI